MILVLLAGMVPCRAPADSLAGLLACRGIPRAAARLACFDRESARLVAARGRAADDSAHAADNAILARKPSLEPRRTFGLPEGAIAAREISAGVRAKPLTHISARISSISHAADGRLLFALDNGQMWVELARDDALLARSGEGVKISRQLFGSYWMELQSGRGCKVERVR